MTPVTRDPPLPQRRSVRLRGFDYAQAGVYFVTVCARNRRCLFGEIGNGAMHLNKLGSMARECWLEIPCHFPGVELHAHVVMPNHLHGVLALFGRQPDARRWGGQGARAIATAATAIELDTRGWRAYGLARKQS